MEDLFERLGTKIEVPDPYQPLQDEQPVELLQIKTQDSAKITDLFPHLHPIEASPILIYPPRFDLPGEEEIVTLSHFAEPSSSPPIVEQAIAEPADEALGIATEGEDPVAEVEVEELGDEQPIAPALEEGILEEEEEAIVPQPVTEEGVEETPEDAVLPQPVTEGGVEETLEDDEQPTTPALEEEVFDDEDLEPAPKPDGEAGEDIVFTPEAPALAQAPEGDSLIPATPLPAEEAEEEEETGMVDEDYQPPRDEEEARSVPRFEAAEEGFSEEEEENGVGRPAAVTPEPVEATPDRLDLIKDPFPRDGLLAIPENAAEIYMSYTKDSGQYPQPTRVWKYYDIIDIGEGNDLVSSFICKLKNGGTRLFLSVAIGEDQVPALWRLYFDPEEGTTAFKSIVIPKTKAFSGSELKEKDMFVRYPLELEAYDGTPLYLFLGYSPDGETDQLLKFDPDKETFAPWGPVLSGVRGVPNPFSAARAYGNIVVSDNHIYFLKNRENIATAPTGAVGQFGRSSILYGDDIKRAMRETVEPCYPSSLGGWSYNIINSFERVKTSEFCFKYLIEITYGPWPVVRFPGSSAWAPTAEATIKIKNQAADHSIPTYPCPSWPYLSSTREESSAPPHSAKKTSCDSCSGGGMGAGVEPICSIPIVHSLPLGTEFADGGETVIKFRGYAPCIYHGEDPDETDPEGYSSFWAKLTELSIGDCLTVKNEEFQEGKVMLYRHNNLKPGGGVLSNVHHNPNNPGNPEDFIVGNILVTTAGEKGQRTYMFTWTAASEQPEEVTDMYQSWDGNMEWHAGGLWPSKWYRWPEMKQEVIKINAKGVESVVSTIRWGAAEQSWKDVSVRPRRPYTYNEDGYGAMKRLLVINGGVLALRDPDPGEDDKKSSLFGVGDMHTPVFAFDFSSTASSNQLVIPSRCDDKNCFLVTLPYPGGVDVYNYNEEDDQIEKIHTITPMETSIVKLARLGINVLPDPITPGDEKALGEGVNGKIFIMDNLRMVAVTTEGEDPGWQQVRADEVVPFRPELALLDDATILFNLKNMVYIYNAEWEIDDSTKGLRAKGGGVDITYNEFKGESDALSYRGVGENSWWWRSIIDTFGSSGPVKLGQNLFPCGIKKSPMMTTVITSDGSEWMNINNSYQWIRLWPSWYRDIDGKEISYQAGEILEKST